MSDINMKTVLKGLTIGVFMVAVSACSGSKDEAAARYLNSGIELYEAEKLSKASVELRNALQIDPKLASAYYYLALISEKEENWKALFKNLTRVEQLDKTHIGAKVKLGYLMLLAKQFDQAIERADAVLLLDKDNPDGFLIKASAFLGKGMFDVALGYVEKAKKFGADRV
jgi:Tfp pilus assembly protein PilF